MKIDKIGLFGKRLTSYDDAMLFGLAEGFRRCGVEPFTMTRLLDPPKLLSFCKYHTVSVILEINRTRNQIPALSPSITHVAWLQDPVTPERREPSRSEITYYLTSPDVLGYDTTNVKGLTGILYTGVSTAYLASPPAEPLSDFSFVGYLPGPLPAEWRSQPMLANMPKPTLGEVVDAFSAWYRSARKTMTFGDLHTSRLEKQIRAVMAEAFGVPFGAPFRHHNIPLVFEQYVVRALDRMLVIDAVLTVSKSMRIYGLPYWTLWERYRPYYRKYLIAADDMAFVYRTTRLNLHSNPNGFGMHARVLDCMGCGQAILVNESPYDQLPGGIRTEFEPHAHYIPYTVDTLAETAQRWLSDEKERRYIGEQARKIILEKHSWQHRAMQIIDDLQRIES